MMLLPEEQYLLHWLSQYEILSREQAIHMLNGKTRDVAEKIIRGLQKQRRIVYINRGSHIALDRMARVERKMAMALWILIQFMDRVDPMAHYPAPYPSQIYFLKDSTGYEIIVLGAGEERLTTLLQPQENMKYIIVVPDASVIPKVPIPDAPCLFAVLRFLDGPVPEVQFFTSEESKSGK